MADPASVSWDGVNAIPLAHSCVMVLCYLMTCPMLATVFTPISPVLSAFRLRQVPPHLTFLHRASTIISFLVLWLSLKPEWHGAMIEGQAIWMDHWLLPFYQVLSSGSKVIGRQDDLSCDLMRCHPERIISTQKNIPGFKTGLVTLPDLG